MNLEDLVSMRTCQVVMAAVRGDYCPIRATLPPSDHWQCCPPFLLLTFLLPVLLATVVLAAVAVVVHRNREDCRAICAAPRRLRRPPAGTRRSRDIRWHRFDYRSDDDDDR